MKSSQPLTLDKMAQFVYKGLSFQGLVVKDIKEAPTKSHLYALLAEEGIHLIWCRRYFSIFSLFRYRPTAKDWEPFCIYLFHLLKGGVSLKDALEDYKKICPLSLRPQFEKAFMQLTEGGKVSQIFPEMMDIYPSYVRGLLELAESTGKLADAFHRIGDHFKWNRLLHRKIKSVVRYPILLFIIVSSILLYLGYFLLPLLQDFFLHNNQTLPASTHFLLSFIQGIHSYGLFFLGVLLILGSSFWLLYTRTSYAILIDKGLYKIPLIGSFLKAKDLCFQCEFLSSLLSANVNILTALEIVEKQAANKFLRQTVQQIQQKLCQGQSLSESYAHFNLYPPFMVHLIQVGERTDALDSSFTQLKDYFSNEVNDALSFLSELLQPILLLILGAFLLVFVYALLYPFYESLSMVTLS